MRAFHGTDPANVAAIKREGLRPNFGEIYLTYSAENAARWKSLFLKQVAVIEVEVDGRTL